MIGFSTTDTTTLPSQVHVHVLEQAGRKQGAQRSSALSRIVPSPTVNFK